MMLRTSPRDAVKPGGYVFSASELPGFYPIPAHNEMSFTAHPPRRIFFACTIAPEKFGETPLVDFRGVWRDLDPELRPLGEHDDVVGHGGDELHVVGRDEHRVAVVGEVPFVLLGTAMIIVGRG